MRQNQLLSIAIIILMICFGCKKNSDNPTNDPGTDLATTVAGDYTGTWVVTGSGLVNGTCDVVKVSNTTVNLIRTAGGQSMPTLTGVQLSSGANGKINFTYSDAGITLSGTFDNHSLTMTIISGNTQTTFSGSNELAAIIMGNYTGTWVVPGLGQVSGTCNVVKVSSTKVNIIGTAGGQSLPTIPGVMLSDGGNGKINLTYSDASGTLTGVVVNNSITLTLKAGTITETFSGTKQ